MSVSEGTRRRVRRQLYESAQRKGSDTENKVDEALNWLVENNKISAWWQQTYEEDRYEGIDRHVQLIDGSEMPLQIKGSPKGFEQALANHPGVPCIKVEERFSKEDLAWRVLGILTKPLNNQ